MRKRGSDVQSSSNARVRAKRRGSVQRRLRRPKHLTLQHGTFSTHSLQKRYENPSTAPGLQMNAMAQQV
eukprot:3593536-Rhodomonas_salina.2